MLTPQLQKNIDEKWDNCWPVSNLRPSALLDLISYIFFIKKLDDRELLHKNSQVKHDDNFIYTKDVEEFDWSKLKNMNAQSIHDLFTREHGIIDFMIQYGHSNSLYSDFFKAPLLISPTPKLLYNVIEIINLVEISDKKTQGLIAEYLFSKTKIAEQNSQEFIPEYLSRLIVSIAEPDANDFIWDPAAGNGSLLINAERYVTNRNNAAKTLEKNSSTGNGNFLIKAGGNIVNRNYPAAEFENDASLPKLKGVESDLIQLRLAAMNIMLHGIKNPNLEPLAEKSLRNSESPTLIISSLLLPDSETGIIYEENAQKPVVLEKEITLMNQVLNNLRNNGRGVIMVPEVLLKSITPEIKKVRQDIIENNHLEGVITLPQKSESIFSGVGILIFNNNKSIAVDDVWFCKMEKRKEKRGEEKKSYDNENDLFLSSEFSQVKDILNKWRDRKSAQPGNRNNGFFISRYDIKANDYNLNFSDYKLIQKNGAVNNHGNNFEEENDTIVATKKEHLHHFFEDSPPIEIKRRKSKLLPVIIVLLILIAGAGFYFYDFKTNSFNFNLNFNTGKKPDSASIIDSVSVIDTKPLVNTKPLMQQPADSPVINKSTTKKILPTPVPKAKPKNQNDAPLNNVAATSTQYTVISKAFFYSQPDLTTQQTLFLQARPDLTLTPKNEKNGFVYVIYVNKKGESTTGWLNKKDLQPVE